MSKPHTRGWSGRLTTCLYRLLSSRTFLWIVLGWLAAQAIFVALTGAYSMAFDEYVHFGSTQLYAQHWWPFAVAQPDGPAVYGSVTTDGSFLYYYLMSFPLRLLQLFTASQTAQIVGLRLINVLFLVAAVYVFWKVLRRAGASKLVSNIVIAVFAILPTVPFLGGQINYDNLIMLCAAIVIYLAVHIVLELQQKNRLAVRALIALTGMVLLSSCVKYTFLPLGGAVMAYVLVVIGWAIFRHKINLKKAFKLAKPSLTRRIGLLSIAALLLGSFFFAGRYGSNVIRYHSLLPKCEKVLSVESCKGSAPFARDEQYRAWDLPSKVDKDMKKDYPYRWSEQMLWETFFTVSPEQLDYKPGDPLLPSYRTGGTLLIVALVMVASATPWLWRRSYAHQLFLVAGIFYTAVLFWTNYNMYLSTGVKVAIHGRYVFPVIILFGWLAVEVMRALSRRLPTGFKLALAGVTMVLLFVGGGIQPYIVRSTDEWLWPSARSWVEPLRHPIDNLTLEPDTSVHERRKD